MRPLFVPWNNKKQTLMTEHIPCDRLSVITAEFMNGLCSCLTVNKNSAEWTHVQCVWPYLLYFYFYVSAVCCCVFAGLSQEQTPGMELGLSGIPCRWDFRHTGTTHTDAIYNKPWLVVAGGCPGCCFGVHICIGVVLAYVHKKKNKVRS